MTFLRKEFEEMQRQLDAQMEETALKMEAVASQLADAASAEEVAAILQPSIDRLKAIGADPPAPAPDEPTQQAKARIQRVTTNTQRAMSRIDWLAPGAVPEQEPPAVPKKKRLVILD
jgi:hypothetical protein